MNNTEIFFTTRTEDRHILPCLGNTLLAPVRYLFNGRTVSILTKEDLSKEVIDKYSFAGNDNPLLVIAALILFIPSLIFGSILKGTSFLSESTKKDHELVKKHFTPMNVYIGTPDDRKDEKQIRDALKVVQNPLHQRINAVIIYGNNVNLSLNIPSLDELMPEMGIILDGVRIHKIGLTENSLEWQLIGLGFSHNRSGYTEHINEWPRSSVQNVLDHPYYRPYVYLV